MKHKIIVSCLSVAITLLPFQSGGRLFALEPLRRQHIA